MKQFACLPFAVYRTVVSHCVSRLDQWKSFNRRGKHLSGTRVVPQGINVLDWLRLLGTKKRPWTVDTHPAGMAPREGSIEKFVLAKLVLRTQLHKGRESWSRSHLINRITSGPGWYVEGHWASRFLIPCSRGEIEAMSSGVIPFGEGEAKAWGGTERHCFLSSTLLIKSWWGKSTRRDMRALLELCWWSRRRNVFE